MSHAHHGHSNGGCNHIHQPTYYGFRFALGILLNVAFVIVELIYGKKSGSSALIADAIHNIGDVAGLLISFIGILLLTVKKTKNLTFALKKATIIASFLNAIILIVGVFYLFTESIIGFASKREVIASEVIFIALIGVVVNGITAFLFLSGAKDDINIKSAFLHMLADALVSLGVIVSGIIVLYTGLNAIDGITGIIIGVIILITTFGLLKESSKLLFMGVPSGINVVKVEDAILSADGVLSMHDLHIWAISTTENAISFHIKVSEGYSNVNLTTKLKQSFNLHHFTIQIDNEDDVCYNKC